MQAEAQIVRGLFRMQPVCSGCVNRDERLLASGASDLREVGESGKPVRVGAHTLGRVFRTFRDFSMCKTRPNRVPSVCTDRTRTAYWSVSVRRAATAMPG
jgi:hypothetical protein